MELVLQQLQEDLKAFKRLKQARQLPHQKEQVKGQTPDRAVERIDLEPVTVTD